MKISQLKGVGIKRARALQLAKIFTISDLLNHFPKDYDDRSEIRTINSLIPDTVNTIRGIVTQDPENATLKNSLNLTKVKIKDHTGTLELIWFNQPYLKKYFKRNTEYIFTGKIKNGSKLQMQSPDYEPCGGAELSGGRIVPMYTTPKQYSQKTFRGLIHQALEIAPPETEVFFETLPKVLRQKYNLCGRKEAVKNIHFPESNEKFLAARRRLVFEELFFIQRALLDMKGAVSVQTGAVFSDTNLQPFISKLSFKPTAAQTKVFNDIITDLKSGIRMNRLIQGDVGSGKTAIALGAASLAVKNGYQAAIMAPTDVLANQHYTNCKNLGFKAALLTGGIKKRREILAEIENGQAQIIIGTHALFQEGVSYSNLGLVITDEQHRFGVDQRMKLAKKGRYPHTLVMTATPIPRTLAMILYGDLDISIINEMPPGRQQIKTYCVNSKYRQRLYEFIRKETKNGNQAYIICPAIEESEANIKDVISYTEEIKISLPEINISCLHGKMKPAEKQDILDNFKQGIIQVIISTTVIEVGIHVPTATVIIIENAERFGLSQLHQLRGRVGRGKSQSYCVLVTDTKNNETNQRMKAMTDTTCGFKLAELDLEQRGAGDFFGTRQHGLPSFTIANLYRDASILEEAASAAVMKLSGLTQDEEAILKTHMVKVLENTRGGVI